MDEAVTRALARWPNVPDCHGWLALTRRGEWRVGAARERVSHAGLIEFINRNYQRAPNGAWYFQNGPQRVWVTLDYTPLVYRLQGDANAPQLVAHTGAIAREPRAAALDEEGSLIIDTELGPGVVDDRDLAAALPLIAATVASGESAAPLTDSTLEHALANPAAHLTLALGATCLPIERVLASALAQRFRYAPQPASA